MNHGCDVIGGDCPEYCLTGIEQGILLAEPGSNVFVFTDASAKDANRSAAVIDAAVAKSISVSALLLAFRRADGKRGESWAGVVPADGRPVR